MKKPNVVVIGGGTGSFTLLSSLKELPINLTAIVSMADDGGSTGILRDQLGVLPPGDIRQCLVALSDASEELRDLFTFRFPSGSDLAGHSFGNIFLSAVEAMTTDFQSAVRVAGDILRIRGTVLPATLDDSRLVLKQGGKEIVGQHLIVTTKILNRQPDLSLTQNAKLNPDAQKAIQQADLVIIAPGLLYGSLAPALLVSGMGQALKDTEAPIVYVANLANKPLHTQGYAVHDYAAEIERFIAPATLSMVVYNNEPPTEEQLQTYVAAEELPVEIQQTALDKADYVAVPLACLSHDILQQDPNDTLVTRTFIRHNGAAIADWTASYLQL